MPGIVIFKRRWSAGSDDLVVPTVILIVFHIAWEIVLVVVMSVVDFQPSEPCRIGLINLKTYVLIYLVMVAVAILTEAIVVWVSMQGSILKTGPRASMQYLLYFRLVVLLFEFSWQVVGMVWLVRHYNSCPNKVPKKVTLSIIVFNWIIMLVIIISIWCNYDYAGGKWVKMKRYQDSMNERRQKRHSRRRNWRQREYHLLSFRRKALRAYEQSWDRRFNMLCCCVDRENKNRNSIAEIAKLFTEFFRDLDVVPSDVIAGFVLLRRYQSIKMRHIMSQGNNDVYQYISGVPITPDTSFLQLAQPEVLEEFHRVIHYMRFALAAYGWPAYMLINTSTGLCKMLPSLRCCCCQSKMVGELVDDNCCQCNFVALLKLSTLKKSDIVYVTYHVDIGETPFYVAVDHKYRKVVICVRGTNSLQDVLTDLKADAEVLPLEPLNEEWVGHKGMVQAAVYIRDKLKQDMILAEAFSKDNDKGTHKYDLVLVGHSLGAGTAAILAILLKQEYPSLHCYSFSPPGGLLSEACVNDTKSFITSVVLAKDIVPRIGLPQLEVLRTDLINVIKNSLESKWKIITRALCCGNDDARNMDQDQVRLEMERDIRAHPSDSAIALSSHTPLYPPGKIIHIVRSHPQVEKKLGCCKSEESVYQAIWADNKSFDEVLVSPTMITDHMPDNVMDALEKVLVNVAPPKPNRTLTEAERKAFLEQPTPTSETALSTDKLVQQADHIELTVQADQQTLPTYVWENGGESVMAVDDQGNLIFTSSRNKPKLVLDLNKDTVEAPLASPENLSEKSSLSGSGSHCNVHASQRDSYRKSLQSPQMLETIQQSPLDKNRPLNFPNFPEKNNDSGVKSEDSETDCQLGKLNNSSILTQAVVENPPKCNNKQGLNSSGETVHSQTECSNVSSDTSEEACKTLFNLEDEKFVYNRNSPVDGNQSEYGNPNSYYSAAGIGYPHGSGAYHPPMKTSITSDIVDHHHQPMKNFDPSPHHHHHLSKNLSDTEALGKHEKSLKCSQSESYLQTLSDKYTMHRSMEHGDIAHLQDSAQVFEAGGYIPVHDTHCNRRSQTRFSSNMTELTEETQADSISPCSPGGDSDKLMSSPHSDEVFDLPLQETDV